MLKVVGVDDFDTRSGHTAGTQWPVEWVPVDDPDPDNFDEPVNGAFAQGSALGGAIFARGEGAWEDDGRIYLCSTSGGDAGAGQIFEYTPTDADSGVLTLLFESPDRSVMNSPDNITVAPSGLVLVCEDGDYPQHVRGITEQGQVFTLARNDISEFAGGTFSPDGEWFFVNIQRIETPALGIEIPGIGGIPTNGATFAITGPWERGLVAAAAVTPEKESQEESAAPDPSETPARIVQGERQAPQAAPRRGGERLPVTGTDSAMPIGLGLAGAALAVVTALRNRLQD